MAAMSDDLATRIRELHRPLWHDPLDRPGERQVWLVCHGCDAGAHAESPADWPCATAEIVYSPAEIAAREPQVPECAEDPRAQAVFVRSPAGRLMARRWKCDHIQPASVESSDPWE
jgi:hypothetical protein